MSTDICATSISSGIHRGRWSSLFCLRGCHDLVIGAIEWPIQGKAASAPPFFFVWSIEKVSKARMTEPG